MSNFFNHISDRRLDNLGKIIEPAGQQSRSAPSRATRSSTSIEA